MVQTRCKHRVIGRHPTPLQCSTVFDRVEIRLARATPGTKEHKIFYPVAEKERLGVARSKPVTKKRDQYKIHQIWPSGINNFSMKYDFNKTKYGGLVEVCTIWVVSSLLVRWFGLNICTYKA